ncbi:MAG: TerD family protein [Gordonia sp. (in: high G+C Gram-positive bacteria)]
MDIPDHLTTTTVTATWRTAGTTEPGLDLDLAVLALAQDGTVLGNAFFVFFNNVRSPHGEIALTIGDRGATSAVIDLGAMPAACHRIALVVSVYNRLAGFGRLPDAAVTVTDQLCGPVAEYPLATHAADAFALTYAELVRDGDRWRFLATGRRHADLRAAVGVHGVTA